MWVVRVHLIKMTDLKWLMTPLNKELKKRTFASATMDL